MAGLERTPCCPLRGTPGLAPCKSMRHRYARDRLAIVSAYLKKICRKLDTPRYELRDATRRTGVRSESDRVRRKRPQTGSREQEARQVFTGTPSARSESGRAVDEAAGLARCGARQASSHDDVRCERAAPARGTAPGDARITNYNEPVKINVSRSTVACM